jgi:hypothetical protein
MVRTEVKISMKKKYSACLYFKILKSYPNKNIYNKKKKKKKNKKKQRKKKLRTAIIFGAHLGFSLQVIHS